VYYDLLFLEYILFRLVNKAVISTEKITWIIDKTNQMTYCIIDYKNKKKIKKKRFGNTKNDI
jgi:hypothetical protein